MKDAFIKIACATPDVKIADCQHNTDRTFKLIMNKNFFFRFIYQLLLVIM